MSVALDLFPCPSPVAPARPRLRAVPDGEPVATPPPVAAPVREPVRRVPGEVARLRAPAGAESAAPLRLTRRGVTVLTLLVATIGGALVWWAAASSPAAVHQPPVPAAVTVRAGDTLWSIAERYAGARDPRAVVDAIQQRNHLSGVGLVPGQLLRLR